MKLYRLLGASSKVKTINKVESSLLKYGQELSNGLNLKKINGIGKDINFDGLGILEVERALKRGDLSSLDKIFDFKGVISQQVKSTILDEVKNLPSFKLGKMEETVTKIKNSKIPSELKVAGKDVPLEDVVKTKNGNSIINYLKGKSYKSLTLGTIVFGTSAALIVAVVNKHRDEMSGCFKYSIDSNGLLTACKIMECSCKDGGLNIASSMVTCAAPPNMKGGDCTTTTGYACVNCPSEEVEDELRGDLDDPNSLDQDETVYYQCNNPSFFDALGDIMQDFIKGLGNVLDDIKEGGEGILSWVTKNLKFIGIAIVIAIIIIITAVVFSMVRKINSYSTPTYKSISSSKTIDKGE